MKNISLRRALIVNLSPLSIFTVVILGITGVVLGTIEAQTATLSTDLEQANLQIDDLHWVGNALRVTWLGSLAGFLIFTAFTVSLSLWVHRVVEERVRHLIDAAHESALGRVGDAPPTVASGPLGELERAIFEIGQSIHERDRQLRAESEFSKVDAQLQRALDLCDTETEAVAIVERALAQVMPDSPAEILLADSSEAHLRRVTGCEGGDFPGCPVDRPFRCAAVRRGQTLNFPTSEALDACPKLREHDGAPLSATCSPLNVMGRTIGVLHISGPNNTPTDPATVRYVDTIATQAGARLGMLRTLATTQLQASRDPLTGLMNRRSFEDNSAKYIREGEEGPHALVMCDLDHFKRLNDTHGHKAGDRALELFSEVLKATIRGEDIAGRHGGEEFVLFLVGCDAAIATTILERLRQKLASAVQRYSGPGFTASFGVAIFNQDGRTLPDLIDRADAALYHAKKMGRNCVVTSEALYEHETVEAATPDPIPLAQVG